MSIKPRYHSLDVFRGMDVALMIVVNSLGSSKTYSPLLHAEWNGFTLTDLVFPTFLFVVGNAMSFSLQSYEAKGEAVFLRKIFVRSLIIFICGYLMYWFPFFRPDEAGGWHFMPISETRIFGVLQRIALCYLFASLILHYLKLKGALIFAVCALIGYRFILAAFGDLTLEGNAVLQLDLWLFGPSHLYTTHGVQFDPEGLLSTLPAIVNVIAGYAAGLYFQKRGLNYEAIAKILMVGCALIFFGIAWDLLFPINKRLWTSSYVLLTVGIDFIVLSILIFLIDIAQFKRWTYFFEVFGRNTLFIYLLSEFLVIVMYMIPVGEGSLYGWTYVNLFQSWAGDLNGSPLFAIAVMLFCWVAGYAMDKKKIYIKV